MATRHHLGVGAMLSLVGVVLVGCGASADPSMAPATAVVVPDPSQGDLSSIRHVRGQYGLRDDRAWIEAVEVDPASVERYGIKVSPGEAADLDDRALTNAIELRGELGFSTDREWVRAVLADPSSMSGPQELVVSPDELRAWEAANEREFTAKSALSLYAREHHDEWAGSYEDQDATVVLVTDNVDAHRAALSVLVPGELATIDVRLVDWSLGELNERLNPIEDAVRTWAEARGMLLWSANVDVPSNRVAITLKLDGAWPGVEREVLDEFDGDGWMTVTARVRPGAGLGRGRLDVLVVDPRGEPVPDVTCVLVPDIPGAADDEEIRFANEQGVCRWQAPRIGATTYAVQVLDRLGGRVLGVGRVTVTDGGEAQVTIAISRH